MTNKLAKSDWYQLLIEDCQAIVTETVFSSNWILIEGYHNLGKRIVEERENFKRMGVSSKKIASLVSQSIGKSKRTVQRAIQFYQKYPDLSVLPEGKNVTWHRIVNKYLPEHTKEPTEKPRMVRCDKCNGYYLVGPNICKCHDSK